MLSWLAVDQSESAIHIHIAPLCHHRALNKVPCTIQWVLISYYFIHSSIYMSILISQFVPPPLPPRGVHTCVLYICVSTSALQMGSSVPFF